MELLVTFIAIILGVCYWKFSHRHPKKFPPGPRYPVPLFGDAYVLGSDLNEGFKILYEKYGKVCGFWLGSQRAHCREIPTGCEVALNIVRLFPVLSASFYGISVRANI